MPNSVKARLKKLEDRLQVYAPNGSEKVCYLLVDADQYEQAMAIGNLTPMDQPSDSHLCSVVLQPEEWQTNDKLVILELGGDTSPSGSH